MEQSDMSGFLYFIEGKKAAGSDVLEAAGLTHALAEGEITTCEATKGPGKTGGIVAAVAGTEAALVKYTPKLQTWTPIEGGGRRPEAGGEPTASGLKPVVAWLGYYTDDPPGPMDLIRPDAVLDGYTKVLESPAGPDQWIIPRARIYTEDVAGGTVDGPTSDLPQSLSMVGGKLIEKPLPRYRQACLDAERIWAAVMSANDAESPADDAVTLDSVEEFHLAVRILAINYRVGIPEINALGVVTTATKGEIIKCFVDFPAYAKVQSERAAAKKAEPSSEAPGIESSSSGPPAG